MKCDYHKIGVDERRKNAPLKDKTNWWKDIWE
jgi:hypothetical protein